MAHYLAYAARYLAEIMVNSQSQEHYDRRERCLSESFFRYNSQVFVGHESRREANYWFETTQKLMVAFKCIDEEMVNYGSLKLVGEASKWWGPIKASLEDELEVGDAIWVVGIS
jgi:hypothetical protein